MKYLIILIPLIISGCCRYSANNEPDTEWILEQYKNQNEKSVDDKRIAEGW